MIAYICDRCGETYTSNTYGDYISEVAIITKLGEIEETMDMCDGCFKDFFNFMNNETVYKYEKVMKQ